MDYRGRQRQNNHDHRRDSIGQSKCSLQATLSQCTHEDGCSPQIVKIYLCPLRKYYHFLGTLLKESMYCDHTYIHKDCIDVVSAVVSLEGGDIRTEIVS